MKPGHIAGATMRLGAPANWDVIKDGQCDALEIRREAGQMHSNWYPSPEELAALNRGAPVTLTVWGSAHPPVSLNVTHQPMAKNGKGNYA